MQRHISYFKDQNWEIVLRDNIQPAILWILIRFSILGKKILCLILKQNCIQIGQKWTYIFSTLFENFYNYIPLEIIERIVSDGFSKVIEVYAKLYILEANNRPDGGSRDVFRRKTRTHFLSK